nr:hypothetical protein [Tanacetum cinerariifolium]
MWYWLRLDIGKLLPPSGNLHKWGFVAVLAVLVIRASQSRQHDKSKSDFLDPTLAEFKTLLIFFVKIEGDNNSSGTKKYQGSNSNDGGNNVDEVKIIGEVIGFGGGIVMSSPTHPTPSDVDEEYAFPFANILDYTLTLLNYFPATPGNISSDFLEN